MKSYWKVIALGLCFGLLSNISLAIESDTLGLPGDDLDLYGVLELFENSESIEAFEKALNTESNHVNNLDLNGDGEIDYIKVSDETSGDAHALVLQVPVNDKESQDVAVIEIEKNKEGDASLQVVGDEDLYGKDYIIEPYEDKSNEMPNARAGVRIVVNVWGWRPVRFIYGPRYVVWRSPYRWGHYPIWWKPWRPLARVAHYNHCRRFHGRHFHVVHVHRMHRAHAHYHKHRVASRTVKKRHAHRHAQHHANRKNNVRKGPENSNHNHTSRDANKKHTGKGKVQHDQKQKQKTERKKAVSKTKKPVRQKTAPARGGSKRPAGKPGGSRR